MSAPPGVAAVCPWCRGPLAAGVRSLRCAACAREYRRLGDGADFLGEISDAHTEAQREIYDGDRSAGIRLAYGDLEEYRGRLEGVFAHIRATGLPSLTMRDAMNDAMFRRAGFAPGMEVLDVGSGSGFLLNVLGFRFGVRGTGVDISELAVRRAQEHNPLLLRFHRADAVRLPFADGAFDRVVSFDVLEHLPQQRAALLEAARVVRPGGRLLFYAISSADEGTWHWAQRAATGGRVGTDDGGGHVRELFLDPPTTARWLRSAGFRAVRTFPFHAFFTLLADERLGELVRVLDPSPKRFRAFFRLACAADLPWTAAGLGNGFFLLGTKAGRGA